MHSTGLTLELVPSKHARISTSVAVNINVQLSPSSDSRGHTASLKCNLFLHVAEWTAAYLEVKLAATHSSTHNRKVIALDSWVMTSDYDPEDISICMGPMTVDESNHATGVIISSLTTLNGHMQIILLSELHLQHVQKRRTASSRM